MCVLIVLPEIISCVQLQGSIQDKRKIGKEQHQRPGSSVTYHCTRSRLNNQFNKITFIITLRLCWMSEHTARVLLKFEPQILHDHSHKSIIVSLFDSQTRQRIQHHNVHKLILQHPPRKTPRTPAHLKLWHSNLNHNKHTLFRFFLPCNGNLQFLGLTSGSCLWFIQTWTASVWVTLQTVLLRGLCLQLWPSLLLLYWGLLGAVGTKSQV